MFTGIVEEKGSLLHVISGSSAGEITIRAKKVLEGTKTGDSIAVNGVCLTVTSLKKDSFTADVMPETLRRTNLGELRPGDPVDLERAMPADGRFGGHIVSGHIDGTGRILSMKKEENAVLVTIGADKKLLRFMVEKGSIAIDGISLTIAEVSDKSFVVSIIPHTAKETVLIDKRSGDTVNLETDIVGKYVQRLMNFTDTPEEEGSRITMDFLAENGFF